MTIDVVVAYAGPGVEEQVVVRVDDAATLLQAVARSMLVERLQLDPAALQYAIFGQRARADTRLADGDRVELTRPLVVDAKRARRERAKATPRRPGSGAGKPKP
ncbi:MAG: RnfH family protein [Betaproteobacteria bacterium]